MRRARGIAAYPGDPVGVRLAARTTACLELPGMDEMGRTSVYQGGGEGRAAPLM